MRTSTAVVALGLGLAASAALSFGARTFFPEWLPTASAERGDSAVAAETKSLPTPRRIGSLLTPARARVFEGLGPVEMKITSASAQAQRYFNQGLALAYGFNHAEAAKSFQAASAADDDCAMCEWGLALVLGPNINVPMFDEAIKPANEAVQRARKLAAGATPRERALIEALSRRYRERTAKNADLRDAQYAEAMRQVAADFPADDDIQVLFAEAQMNRTPWAYWSKDGRAGAYTPEIVEVLERVLARNPNHTGANHFIIHAMEASPSPERALPSAERLGKLAPNSGHLVHMPSHIYLRIGRYIDAVKVNEQAAAVDAAYMSSCGPTGVYPLAYVPHNVHFILAAGSLSGQRAKALQAAEKILAGVTDQALRDPALGTQTQHFSLQKMMVHLRFGDWETLAAQPLPASDLTYALAMTHYARGVALARLGRVGEAETEAAALRTLAADPKLPEQMISSTNFADDVLAVAVPSLAAEIAAAKGEEKAAMAAYADAAAAEDQLRYMEPADWSVPVRQSWGAYALKQGKAQEAERILIEDLTRVRENGWSLHGLAAAYQAQGKSESAAEFTRRFETAWAAADFKL